MVAAIDTPAADQKKTPGLIDRAKQWSELRFALLGRDGTVDVWGVLNDPSFDGFRARCDRVGGQLRFFVECPLGATVERAVVDGKVYVIPEAPFYLSFDRDGNDSPALRKAIEAEVNRASELLLGRIVRHGRKTGSTKIERADIPDRIAEAEASWRKQSDGAKTAPADWIARKLDVSVATLGRYRRMAAKG